MAKPTGCNTPVCDFGDPRDVRAVELYDRCRMQQVHDGAFARLEEVPRRALSLTVRFFLRVPRVLVFVNGVQKSAAVLAALEGPIAEARRRPCCGGIPVRSLFLDEAASSCEGVGRHYSSRLTVRAALGLTG